MDKQTEQNLYMATAGVGVLNIAVGLFNVVISILYMFVCIGFITIIPAILQVVGGGMQLAGMRNHMVTVFSGMGVIAGLCTFNIMGMMGSVFTTAGSAGVWYWEQQELLKLGNVIDAE